MVCALGWKANARPYGAQPSNAALVVDLQYSTILFERNDVRFQKLPRKTAQGKPKKTSKQKYRRPTKTEPAAKTAKTKYEQREKTRPAKNRATAHTEKQVRRKKTNARPESPHLRKPAHELHGELGEEGTSRLLQVHRQTQHGREYTAEQLRVVPRVALLPRGGVRRRAAHLNRNKK